MGRIDIGLHVQNRWEETYPHSAYPALLRPESLTPQRLFAIFTQIPYAEGYQRLVRHLEGNNRDPDKLRMCTLGLLRDPKVDKLLRIQCDPIFPPRLQLLLAKRNGAVMWIFPHAAELFRQWYDPHDEVFGPVPITGYPVEQGYTCSVSRYAQYENMPWQPIP